MPRSIKHKDRWTIAIYPFCYCFPRDGYVHTNVYGKRQTTKLKWHKSNKRLALEILEKRIIEYHKPEEKKIIHGTYTVTFLFDEFKKVHFPNYSYANKTKIKQAYKILLQKNFRLDDTITIRNHIIGNIQKQSHLHSNTRRKLLSLIKQIFNFGIEQGWCDKNPVLKAMLPRRVPTEVVVFTKEEISQIIKHFYAMNNIQMALLVEFIYITAVRIGEALRLKWQDVEDNRIIIHGKGSRKRNLPRKGFPEIEPVLMKLKEINKDRAVFSWNHAQIPERQLKNALIHLNITKNVSFHSIRKTRENELITQCLPINTVAEILGHTLRTMEKHYIAVLGPDKLTEILKKYKKESSFYTFSARNASLN